MVCTTGYGRCDNKKITGVCLWEMRTNDGGCVQTRVTPRGRGGGHLEPLPDVRGAEGPRKQGEKEEGDQPQGGMAAHIG